MIRRGEIWWADLGEPRGSAPGDVRPVVVIQANELNDSRLRTTVVAVLTSNLQRAGAPGNVYCPARATKLPKDSVLNVSQLTTIDKSSLLDHVGSLPHRYLDAVDNGLRLALEL